MASDLKRNRSVDADMARVFGTGPDPLVSTPAEDPGPAAAVPVPVDPADGPPPRRWLVIAAPAIVALFVLVLAVRFALTLVPDAPPAPDPDRIRPAVLDAGVPAPTPSPSPPPTALAATASEEALAPDDFGPAPIERAPDAPPTPTLADTRPSRTAAARPQPRTRANGCAPGSTEDRCIFADVLAADRRLRAAWNRATQAGVPNDELIPIRRRWTRARGISLDTPDETIRRYDDLAAALDDLVETEQR